MSAPIRGGCHETRHHAGLDSPDGLRPRSRRRTSARADQGRPVVYALQSDVQNWDPPNSVLRESIILGYNVFDHLAARDLKTGKVGPSLAVVVEERSTTRPGK